MMLALLLQRSPIHRLRQPAAARAKQLADGDGSRARLGEMKKRDDQRTLDSSVAGGDEAEVRR
jgi:hypothetical protein